MHDTDSGTDSRRATAYFPCHPWQSMSCIRVRIRYFLELSESEMAEALGVAPGTVKSRLHRGLSRLRAVVEREFPGLAEERAG